MFYMHSCFGLLNCNNYFYNNNNNNMLAYMAPVCQNTSEAPVIYHLCSFYSRIDCLWSDLHCVIKLL